MTVSSATHEHEGRGLPRQFRHTPRKVCNLQPGLTGIQIPSTTNGPEMTSTNRAAISTRVSQCLAATALMAGLAIGSATVGSAEPNSGEWDIGTYDECVKKGLSKRYCCHKSGGVYTESWQDPPNTCVAPAP